MSCDEAQERRLARAAEPGAAPDAALTAHLAGCPACARFCAELDRLEGGLTDALQAAVGGAPDARSSAAAARVVAALPKSRARRARRAGWLAAAALLLAAGLGWRASAPGGPAAGQLLVSEAGDDPERAIAEGAWVRLGPASRARVVSLAPRLLSLEAGRLDCRVRPGSGPFVVEAPGGRVSVVGTEFSVLVLPPGGVGESMKLDRKSFAVGGGAGALAVTVVAGVVLLEADGGASARVQAGQVGFADARGVEVAELASLRGLAERGRRAEALEAELGRAQGRLAAAEAELRGLRERPAAATTSTVATPGPAVAPGPAEGPGPAELADPVARVVAGLDWAAAAQALASNARRSTTHSPQTPEELATLSRLQLTLVDLARALGTEDVEAVLHDARVREAFLPAWVDALGTKLDPAQRERLREAARHGATGVRPGEPAQGYLQHKLAEVRGDLELDALLGEVLRPEQRGAYVEAAGDDPYFGARHLSTRGHGPASQAQLVDAVTDDWLEGFGLDPGLRPIVRARAQEFVRAALAIPPLDPSLDAPARRRAALERAERHLALQLGAEEALAAELPVDDAARARIRAGSRTIISVTGR